MNAFDAPLRFGSVDEAFATLKPDRPLHCLHMSWLSETAQTFLSGFPGDTLFAVKCNAHPVVLRQLSASGIRHYDVASDLEIELVRRHCPGAVLYYHHPAKTPESIRKAYEHADVRIFAVDCREELAKVVANTGPDAAITVRMAVPQDHSVYDLSTKFGASPQLARQLMAEAAAQGRSVGVTFHVGSQCLEPIAYERAMTLASEVALEAGVRLAYMDVGGGFPGYYRTTEAPPLSDYFATIRKTGKALCQPIGTRLMCEPGRALVYGAGTLLTRVILRKDRTVYLNDGIFGGLAEIYWGGDALILSSRVRPADGRHLTETHEPFTVYGPTCDGNDRLPYPLPLPQDITDGDWIEFLQTGAYGREMSTRYNGLRSDELVIIDDPG